MGRKTLDADESLMDTSVANETLGEPSTEKDVYTDQCALVNAIASPLANRKLAKKVYKLIKKSTAEKNFLKKGMADVAKAIRKDEKGIVVLAGNVTPIDIYSHIPGYCEDKEIPYVFLPSRESLGLATGYRRSAIILLIKSHNSYKDLYDEVYEATNALYPEAKQ
ncbi:unnamed protein product, partial [Mesorhabditis belari]|uniref:H/ACA ribonucleoprotein complex subunit 2 n=1 Tax=Mesorhabditis belari TaxID=2138241 RepID=A0AAF3FEG5_9BILA